MVKFWKNILIKEDGCWEWLGAVDKKGYGHISIKGTNIRVHRYSMKLHGKEIPVGQHVLHKCDNRRCVNPRHLFIGSNKDNVVDRDTKQRQARGEQNGQSKLKGMDVIKIRRYLADGLTHRCIAKEFSVSQSMISNIANNKNWNHLV